MASTVDCLVRSIYSCLALPRKLLIPGKSAGLMRNSLWLSVPLLVVLHSSVRSFSGRAVDPGLTWDALAILFHGVSTSA